MSVRKQAKCRVDLSTSQSSRALYWSRESCATDLGRNVLWDGQLVYPSRTILANSLEGRDAQTKVLDDAFATWLEGSYQVGPRFIVEEEVSGEFIAHAAIQSCCLALDRDIISESDLFGMTNTLVVE